MRTRIALAAATSVTFIASTITLAAASGEAGAAARPGQHSSVRSKRHKKTIRTLRRHGATLVSTADLRIIEHSGHESIGTFSPLSDHASARANRHRGSGTHIHSAPTPVAASAAVGSFAATPAPPVAFPATDVATVAPPSPPPVTDATSTDTPDWQCIRVQESGDVYNDPARPSGAYGILDSTWLALGYGGWPYQASATAQNQAALTLYHEYGWQPWSSRYACGL